MSGETQWNKKIDFSPKKETIAEPPEIIQEGFEEVDEMVQKLKDLQNKKKGFTKLPFLESIYDSIAGPQGEPEPEIEPESEPVIEGMQSTRDKYLNFMRYVSNLPYNISFDVFAYAVVQISTGKQPKYPGKEPVKPPNNALPDTKDKYNKKKEAYDKARKPYNDKKRVADMFNRILTCLIGIFIAYNLYFTYAMTPPPTPGVKSTFDMISDFIENLPPVLTPLKIATTPVVYFLKLMSLAGTGMAAIPNQSLLFFFCLLLSGFFVVYVVGYLNPFSVNKKDTENIIFILIVLASVIATALKICIDFKNATPVTQVPALFLWLLVFGLSLQFLPVGKTAIVLILLYVCMFSMTKSEVNGINVLQTMEDINEKLTGSKSIYDCSDDSPLKQFFNMIDRFISFVIVDNLYAVTIIPISIYNILYSRAISNASIRGFSNFLFSVLIMVMLSNNELLKWAYNKIMKSTLQMPISSQTASTAVSGIRGIGQIASLIARA
jgi:hypothetical protein